MYILDNSPLVILGACFLANNVSNNVATFKSIIFAIN